MIPSSIEIRPDVYAEEVFMKKANKFPLIILLLVLCLFMSGCFYAESSVGNLIEESTLPATLVSSEIVAGYNGLVWIVLPTLEHTSIQLFECGSYVDADWNIIDPMTGFLTGDYHEGHGETDPHFVYDRKRGLFGHPGLDYGAIPTVGMYPLNEFAERVDSWTLQNSDGLIAVQNVDSSLRQYFGCPSEEGLWWSLPADAFSGQFAVMYNRELITDFIFDGGSEWWKHRFIYEGGGSWTVKDRDFITMRKEGSWGLINKCGNIVLPFIFDNLLLIDENTAFAKYKGRYGILDIRSTMANLSNVSNPQIRIDNEFVQIPAGDQQPVIVDGRTLVPLRAVMEALGFEVEWEPTQNRVNLEKPGFDISLTIGSRTMVVNGNNVSLDVPAQLINGRTMVPLRAISEATGMEVRWDGENSIVHIIQP